MRVTDEAGKPVFTISAGSASRYRTSVFVLLALGQPAQRPN
jgi:hypothetical protein